jgi:hypothetical protein
MLVFSMVYIVYIVKTVLGCNSCNFLNLALGLSLQLGSGEALNKCNLREEIVEGSLHRPLR